MRLARLVFLLTAVLLPLAFQSCSAPVDNRASSNTNVANTSLSSNSAPKDNVEEFADLVRLPVAPEEVAWKEIAGSVTAVVRFSPENATRMATEVAKNGQPTPEALTVETWYPAELLAQSEMTGESTINGRSYPAEPFLNPPYTRGKITQIEGTDYFILQISS